MGVGKAVTAVLRLTADVVHAQRAAAAAVDQRPAATVVSHRAWVPEAVQRAAAGCTDHRTGGSVTGLMTAAAARSVPEPVRGTAAVSLSSGPADSAPVPDSAAPDGAVSVTATVTVPCPDRD